MASVYRDEYHGSTVNPLIWVKADPPGDRRVGAAAKEPEIYHWRSLVPHPGLGDISERATR